MNDEFILERLQGDYLPNFNSTYYSGNDFGTYSQSWYLTSSTNDWTMTSNCLSSGTTLAYPSSPPNSSTGNFYMIWEAKSPYCDG